MKKKNEEITFKDILDIFIPKIWIIVLVSLLVASAFALYSLFVVEDTYTSYSILSIRKKTEVPNLNDIAFADVQIDNVKYRIGNDDFLNKILLDVKGNYANYEWLTLSHIKSSISYLPLGNGILKLSVTTGNPQLSFVIAQAVENQIPEEFDDLLPGTFEVFPYTPSFFRDVPNSKGTVKNALLGFVAGAAVSVIAVWLYSIFDVTVKTKKKIEDNFDFPVLGVIPGAETEV